MIKKNRGRFTVLLKGNSAGAKTLDDLKKDVERDLSNKKRVKRVFSEKYSRVYCEDCSEEEYIKFTVTYGKEPKKYM